MKNFFSKIQNSIDNFANSFGALSRKRFSQKSLGNLLNEKEENRSFFIWLITVISIIAILFTVASLIFTKNGS